MIKLSHFIAILNEAIKKKNLNIVIPLNSYVLNILWILYKNAFINGYNVIQGGIEVELKYISEKNILSTMKKISTITRRIYYKHKQLDNEKRFRRFQIVSTSEGIYLITKTLPQEPQTRRGGEYLFKIN